jgi:arylsulfatase A-like enzyme
MIENGTRVEHEGYVSDIITEQTLEWLEDQRDREKPFLLMYQHKAPHREWAPALRHLGHDNDREYPEPPTLHENYSDRGPAVQQQEMTLANHMRPSDLKLSLRQKLNPDQEAMWNAYYQPRNEKALKAGLTDDVGWRYQRYMHDYLGCVKGVDEGVGRVLDYLDEAELTENTLVIYSSDQGFFLGEHGWYDKRWIFEESLRTPLLVRWPGVTEPGTVNSRIVSNLDFAQTILEAAGVPAPDNMQGASLVPLLEGKSPEDWRTAFYYHYYEYPRWHKVMPHYGVVTDRYKLVRFYHPADYWELYDLVENPLETRSYYQEESYTDIRRELHDQLAKLRQTLEVPEDNRE